jgi:hypothetical protein
MVGERSGINCSGRSSRASNSIVIYSDGDINSITNNYIYSHHMSFHCAFLDYAVVKTRNLTQTLSGHVGKP